jgi:protein-S-isoprenylcysteine O-methyltransferase Ste14
MIPLALLWTCWCLVHSLLITARLNSWIRSKGGLLQGIYRIVYILFAIISLVPVLWYQYQLPQQLLFSWPGPWRILQGGLLMYAILMFYGGTRVYDTDFFLGISQWHSYRQNREINSLPFSCRGILRYVRHPWYSGGIAFLWGLAPITDVNLLVRSILSVYLVIGTLLEERKLVRELGSPYRNYCNRVPMLIPWRGKVDYDKILS